MLYYKSPEHRYEPEQIMTGKCASCGRGLYTEYKNTVMGKGQFDSPAVECPVCKAVVYVGPAPYEKPVEQDQQEEESEF